MSAAAQDDTAVAARTELRNYHVRTYSGDSLLHQARAGLLRSTTISSLVKPNPGLKFTKVELGIAPDIDMKLMDIIMGNDMLHEGVIKNEDKQNLSKDIKSALGGTGKRIGLKNRYEAHREAFFSAVKQISQNRNEMIRTILVKFQEKWSTISQDMSRLLQVVTTDKVGELTYDEYLDALKSIGQGNQKRKLLIDQQRTKIEDIETGRTEQINSSVNKAGIALNSLNLYPPVTVQRFLDNRKSIANYLTGLEAAAIDSSNILDEHIKNNGKSWNETRYKFTFSSFCDAVRKNLDVNVRGLFEQYQKEFSIEELLEHKPDGKDFNWLEQWRQKVADQVGRLHAIIANIKSDLAKMESEMDKKAGATYDYWFGHIQEAMSADPSKLMNDAINEYRQTDLFTSGKLALLSLPSKANINHLIISTVEEYILCIAALKESHVIPRLQELQVLVSKKLFELSYDNDQSRDIVLKNFGKELNAIKTETRDAAILKRIEKCREYLKSVDDLDTEYYHASVKCLEGTTEISKKIHQEYSQQVDEFSNWPELVESVVVNTVEYQIASIDASSLSEVALEKLSKTSESQSQIGLVDLLSTVIAADTDSGEFVASDLPPGKAPSTGNIIPVVSRPATATSVLNNLAPNSDLNGALSTILSEAPSLDLDATSDDVQSKSSFQDASISGQSINFSSAESISDQPMYAAPIVMVDRYAPIANEHTFFSEKIQIWRQAQHFNAQTLLLQKQEEAQQHEQLHGHTKQQSSTKKSAKPVPIDPRTLAPSVLLDGSKPSPIPDALELLKNWGHGVSLNVPCQDEPTNSLLDIHAISLRTLSMARVEMYAHFQSDAKRFLADTQKALHTSIQRLTAKLGNEWTRRRESIERQVYSTLKLAQDRIANIPVLRVSHDNEAIVLQMKTHQLKQAYQAHIDSITASTSAFRTQVDQARVTLTLQTTPNALDRFRALFDQKTRAHGSQVQMRLKRARLDYEAGRSALLKSRDPGNHAAAWQIIHEQHPATDALQVDLDAFRESLQPAIDSAFTDSQGMLDEFDAQIEARRIDLRILEAISKAQRRLVAFISREERSSLKKLVAIEQQVQDANAFLDGNQNDPNSIRYTPDKFESMLGNVETAIANLGSFCFYLGDNNPYTASRLYLMQKSGSAFSLVEEKLFALRSSNISKPASPRKTSQSTHSKPSTAYGETVLPPILQSSKPATASLDVKPNSPIKEHSFARDLNSLASKPTTPFKNTSTKPGTPAAEQALSELVPNTLAIKQAQFAFKLKIAVDALIESTFISGHLPVLAPLPNTKAATLGYASAQINEYSNSTLNGITDRLDSLKASLAHVVSNLSAGHILCTFTEAVSQHESAARDLAKKYASERASIMVTKGQCDNQLKQRLGHPSNTAQLAALDTLAKTTIKAMLGNIETHLADSLSTHAQINQLLLTRAQATCQRIGTIAQIAHYQNIDMGSIDDIREFLAGLGATRGERVGEWMESEKRAEEQWLEKWNMQHDRIAHLY